MKYVTMVQTSDGVLHKTQKDAMRHADKRYGDKLIALAHRICTVDKYKEAHAFIENTLPSFLELAELQKDMILETTEEEA